MASLLTTPIHISYPYKTSFMPVGGIMIIHVPSGDATGKEQLHPCKAYQKFADDLIG